MKRKFAVFDIDGTLIRWQLYHSIVSKLASRGLLSTGADQAIHEARMVWKNRTQMDSFKDYEQTLIKTYEQAITNLKVSDYLEVVDAVFEEYKDQTYRYTRDLITKLKADGYLLFAISGSQQEIISKLAAHYGFDEAIGAQFERNGEYFTGQYETPAFGKQGYFEQLLTKHDVTMEGSIAVGDSESDTALLNAVEQPIVFNPNSGLYELAKLNGWKIVIERKNVVFELVPQDGEYVLKNV